MAKIPRIFILLTEIFERLYFIGFSDQFINYTYDILTGVGIQKQSLAN